MQRLAALYTGVTMRVEQTMRLALREFADPACRRCHGAGFRGELLPDAICRCVAARTPRDDDSFADEEDDLPHAWRAVVHRAQEIHAASIVAREPDDWSG